MRKRPYVGIVFRNEEKLLPLYEVFRSATEPTEESHGHLYGAVIGPFRTVRGANFMKECGPLSPTCQTVSDAERMARS